MQYYADTTSLFKQLNLAKRDDLYKLQITKYTYNGFIPIPPTPLSQRSLYQLTQ